MLTSTIHVCVSEISNIMYLPFLSQFFFDFAHNFGSYEGHCSFVTSLSPIMEALTPSDS